MRRAWKGSGEWSVRRKWRRRRGEGVAARPRHICYSWKKLQSLGRFLERGRFNLALILPPPASRFKYTPSTPNILTASLCHCPTYCLFFLLFICLLASTDLSVLVSLCFFPPPLPTHSENFSRVALCLFFILHSPTFFSMLFLSPLPLRPSWP